MSRGIMQEMQVPSLMEYPGGILTLHSLPENSMDEEPGGLLRVQARKELGHD